MLPVVGYFCMLTLWIALFLQWLYIASIIKNDVLISVLSPPELIIRASLVAQLVKEYACNAGDLGSIPGLGRSPGEGNNYSLQYSGLENSMDYIVHGVTKSQRGLSNFHFTSLIIKMILQNLETGKDKRNLSNMAVLLLLSPFRAR